MVTLLSPGVIFKITSSITFLVEPSTTISSGGKLNPLPNEEIFFSPNEYSALILTACGKRSLGFNVLSAGKLNPISSIFVDLIIPIVELVASNTAPDPAVPFTVVMLEVRNSFYLD